MRLHDKLLPVILALSTGATSCLCAPVEEGRSQARSMVVTRYGIVATEHPLASEIGASILRQGGNAVDAAVAANAALGLMAPMMNGIGGDLFAIVYEAKSGRLYGLNASGWAPAGLTPDFLKSKGITQMPGSGIHSVTVPGAVDGWEKLVRRFGHKRLSQLLAPTIRYAEEGSPVPEILSAAWAAGERKLRQDTNATHTYLPQGHAPRLGEVFRNPDLAWTLRQIAAHGRKGFYGGKVAGRILACSRGLGGTMTAEDLAKFSAQWVEPISTTYRNWTVYEMPPNGQGVAALMMLNLMELYPMAEFGLGSVDAFHTMIEAKKLAYADMRRFVCDPRFNQVPVAGMLSKSYAGERARLLDLAKANCQVAAGQPPLMGNDTTYFCTVDSEGNMVSFIQSNFASFGSGIVPAGTGFILQNRGGLFSLDPASPNLLAGHKRPMHTIIPAFMTIGQIRIAFGIMGGWNQAQAHAQFVSDLVDHHLNLQSALEAPRFTKHSFDGCDVEIEARVPEAIRSELTRRGHQIKVLTDFDSDCGGGQAVMRDFSRGVNYGASDPRKDGAAVAEK